MDKKKMIKNHINLPAVLISLLVMIPAAVMGQVAVDDGLQYSINDLIAEIGTEERNFFKSNNIVFRYDEESEGPRYLPDAGFRREILELHNGLSPEVMVEALYRIEYPGGEALKREDAVRLFNEISHRVSTITGAMYFSRTKQDYAVLFSEVYAVDGVKSGKRIADPEPISRPGGDSVFLFMDEHSMGKGYYRMNYLYSAEASAVCLTNETPMGGFLRTAEPGEMKIFLEMIPCSDAILVYGYCGVVIQNDALVMLLMDPYYSFYRRMTAIETWFANTLHGTDRLPPLNEPMP